MNDFAIFYLCGLASLFPLSISTAMVEVHVVPAFSERYIPTHSPTSVGVGVGYAFVLVLSVLSWRYWYHVC